MDMKFFAKSILLVLVVILTGCKDSSKEPEQSGLGFLSNAPLQIVDKEDLPVWLSEYLDHLTSDDMSTIAFQGKWKKKDVYFVYQPTFSCYLCATFWSNGDVIDFSEKDPSDFCKSSTNWKCIYFHKGLIPIYFYDL